MILFDTDVCIELLRGNRKVFAKRQGYGGEVAVSFFTAAELYYGAEKSSNPPRNTSLVEEFLLSVRILDPDNGILRKFAALKSGLERKGTGLPDADIFIAATSLERCEKLISGNVRHFSRIENLPVENWIH